jgi:hypothetical protein
MHFTLMSYVKSVLPAIIPIHVSTHYWCPPEIALFLWPSDISSHRLRQKLPLLQRCHDPFFGGKHPPLEVTCHCVWDSGCSSTGLCFILCAYCPYSNSSLIAVITSRWLQFIFVMFFYHFKFQALTKDRIIFGRSLLGHCSCVNHPGSWPTL